MFCKECGTENEKLAKFCKKCGTELKVLVDKQTEVKLDMDKNSSSVKPEKQIDYFIQPGFSKKDHHPDVEDFRNDHRSRSLKIGVFLGILFFLGIVLMWFIEEKRVSVQALTVGGGFAAVPIIISLPFYLRSLLRNDWQGTIVKMKSKKFVDSPGDSEDHKSAHEYYKYYVKVKTDGILKKKKVYRNSEVMKYYHVGEMVKYHRNFEYLEKYDKNKDDQIRCINCFEANEKAKDHCLKCGMLLMK